MGLNESEIVKVVTERFDPEDWGDLWLDIERFASLREAKNAGHLEAMLRNRMRFNRIEIWRRSHKRSTGLRREIQMPEAKGERGRGGSPIYFVSDELIDFDDPIAIVLRAEQIEDALEDLRRLDPRYETAIRMQIAGHTVRAIAKATGLTVSGAFNNRTRAWQSFGGWRPIK